MMPKTPTLHVVILKLESYGDDLCDSDDDSGVYRYHYRYNYRHRQLRRHRHV